MPSKKNKKPEIDPKEPASPKEPANSPPSGTSTSPQNTRPRDYFRDAAISIDELAKTDRSTAKQRWKALKESVETDTNGNEMPDIFDAEQIARNITYSVKTLLSLHVFLTVQKSYSFLRTRPELDGKGLPPTEATFIRTFPARCKDKLGTSHPHNYGTAKRKRYAVTYAELLHTYDVASIDLVEGLDSSLRARLEAL